MSEWVDGPVLGIETSGRLTGLALVDRGKLVAESAIDLGASSQELLPGMLRDLLGHTQCSLAEIRRIGVSLGPGSFTGLRVGLSWARALATGSGTPLVGVPSHSALAYPLIESGAQILILTSFRRNQLCLELGEWGPSSQWIPAVEGASVPAEDWSRIALPHLTDRPLIILGEAASKALEVDPSLVGRGQVWNDQLSRHRRPAPIAFLAARPEQSEATGNAVDDVRLLYLRDADAKKPNR